MRWIVNIETTDDERKQRIRIVFDPINEYNYFYGEVKLKNVWVVFSENKYNIDIDLSAMQTIMTTLVSMMRRRLEFYENINKGFTVLKWVGFEEE